jgi:ABC-type bacteriocin/lantibiotic exporter with double-glycine peptidase domain
MPRSIFAFVLRTTGSHQFGLALLSIGVFLLTTVPLELQRRIINNLTERGSLSAVLWLALAYGAVALGEQTLKLLLNVYRGWVAESTVRLLRREVCDSEIGFDQALPSPVDAGVEIAMVLEEAEPIGGFTALCVSEPLLQGGILVSVLSYMFYLQPGLALLAFAFFVPQVVFVPLFQRAINRRAQARILTKRRISGTIAESHGEADRFEQDKAIQRVFKFNMGIYWLKYVLNLLMNLMYHMSVAVALFVGGWLVFKGRIEVGTVVAVASGIAKLNDPWGDLVNWGRELSVVSVKYRLFSEAARWLTGAASTFDEPEPVPVRAPA